MTNEEAIEIITLMRDMARDSVSTNTSNADALDMAIHALEALNCDCSNCLWYQEVQKNLDESEEEE